MAELKIWWSNAIFFVSVHVLTAVGLYHKTWHAVPRATILLWFLIWQAGSFGITIGYHRLWAHKSFRARLPVRIVLAAMGSSAFQGSVKWWCLRHRLHHRFTDDPDHDPYAATKGLFYSHVGWIFFKPTYPRIKRVEKHDLEKDPVVRFQHKHYIPIALLFGFVVPTMIGNLWGDPVGSFIWGGLASKVAIWHCTFLVNSLAHWHGLQPYSDENTSRGNLLLALLTSGEGNHNFHHAFPHDFRSGPALTEWDPSKWAILLLYKLRLVYSLRVARDTDIQESHVYMKRKSTHGTQMNNQDEDTQTFEGPVWTVSELGQFLKDNPGKHVVRIGKYALDITSYLTEHPGGSVMLLRYGVSSENNVSFSATWAFEGGLNNHSRAARVRMREFRIAEIHECDEICPSG